MKKQTIETRRYNANLKIYVSENDEHVGTINIITDSDTIPAASFAPTVQELKKKYPFLTKKSAIAIRDEIRRIIRNRQKN